MSSSEKGKLLRSLIGSHMVYNLLSNMHETFFTMFRVWLERLMCSRIGQISPNYTNDANLLSLGISYLLTTVQWCHGGTPNSIQADNNHWTELLNRNQLQAGFSSATITLCNIQVQMPFRSSVTTHPNQISRRLHPKTLEERFKMYFFPLCVKLRTPRVTQITYQVSRVFQSPGNVP